MTIACAKNGGGESSVPNDLWNYEACDSKLAVIENDVLKISCNTSNASMTVEDKRLGKSYVQCVDFLNGIRFTKAYVNESSVRILCYNSKNKVQHRIQIDLNAGADDTIYYVLEMNVNNKPKTTVFHLKLSNSLFIL